MAISNPTYPGPVYKSILPSPFQVMQFVERNKQVQEERQAKAVQAQMEANAKQLDNAFKYKADPVISQYQDYFNNKVKSMYERAPQLVSSTEGRVQLAKEQSDSDAELNKLKDIQDQMNRVRTLAADDQKNFNSTYVNNALSKGVLYDEKGQLKHPSQLDPEAPYNILQDYRAYNLVKVNKSFADSVEEAVTSSLKSSTRGGIRFQDKYKQASKFAKLDADGNPVYDKDTGRLQLNITPDLVNKYLQDEGGRLIAEQKVKEHVEAGDKNYTLRNAVESLMEGSGYVKRTLESSQMLDKSGLNLNFFGGSAENDQKYKAAAKYFYDVVNGPEETKKTLLGDISSGKEFAASYQKAPEKAEPSNKGYVVIDYDPLSRFGDFMDKILGTQLEKSLGMSGAEAKNFMETARKDHKILVNLDNEEQAWRELNYWRNLARNQDLNSDILKGAFDQYKEAAKKAPGRFNNLGKKKAAADDL